MSDPRINVRVPYELKRRVDHATVDGNLSLTAAVIEAMEAWLENRTPKSTKGNSDKNAGVNKNNVITSVNCDRIPAGVAISFPEDFEPWVSHLLHILEQDNQFAAPSIKKNLEAFVRLTDLDGATHAPPPEETEPTVNTLLEEGSRARAEAEELIEEHRSKRRDRRKAS